MANKNNEDIYCSFCGKPQEMAGRLIAGNGVYICDRCVECRRGCCRGCCRRC